MPMMSSRGNGFMHRRRYVPSNQPPNQPTIGASAITSTGATLTGSAFSDPDVGDTHAASQWQVTTAADTGFATPIYNPGDDAVNKTSLVWSGGSASTNYLARVRYKDSAGNYSAWATAAPFTTSAGGPTTIASDNFNRADNATGLGTTPVGSKVWTNFSAGALSAGLKIVGNAALPIDGGAGCGAYIDAGVTDVTVSCKVNTNDSPNGVLARITDGENYIEAKVQSGGGSVVVRKVIAGSATVLMNPAATWVIGDTITLVCSGNSFTVKQNGTALGTTTDANALSANTKVGLTIQFNGNSVDDFLVTTP